jgi:putative ATP-binding cassette transporter
MALPILVASPRYIAGAISLGMLIQSVQAFQHMVSALSWPVDNMAQIAKWRTSVERVLGLMKALDHLEHDISHLNSHQIRVNEANVSALTFNNVRLEGLKGEMLSIFVNNQIKAGEHVLISDQANNGGKLFKAIAGLWPWGSGQIEVPAGQSTFFMPPKPYLPAKSLFEAICYPKTKESFAQAEVEKKLEQVGQKALIKQLNRVDAWADVLSNEQQQYLGLVRALLHRPQWIFVQEALDSLPPDDEAKMLKLLAHELPHAAILTITHQPDAQAFHHRKLQI